MFCHYTWHKSIETPMGLENIKHGLIPDRSGNSSHSEVFLAITIHVFHQGLQHPERFPLTLSKPGSSKGKACQTTAADAFVSTEHHHSILLIKLLHKNLHRVITNKRAEATLSIQFHKAKVFRYWEHIPVVKSGKSLQKAK